MRAIRESPLQFNLFLINGRPAGSPLRLILLSSGKGKGGGNRGFRPARRRLRLGMGRMAVKNIFRFMGCWGIIMPCHPANAGVVKPGSAALWRRPGTGGEAARSALRPQAAHKGGRDGIFYQ